MLKEVKRTNALPRLACSACQIFSPAAALKRKFAILENATTLSDLACVPGNNFEKYHDHRKGQYSIRVNKKYRLFFTWIDGNAYDVRLADEH